MSRPSRRPPPLAPLFYAALSFCALGAVLVSGRALRPRDSNVPPQPARGQRPGDSDPSAAPGSSRATTPGGLLSQALEGWRRAQAAPPRRLAPAPRLGLAAPPSLAPPLLSAIALAPADAQARDVRFGFGAPPFATDTSGALFSPGYTSADDLWARASRGFGLNTGADREPPGAIVSSWGAPQKRAEARQIAALQDLAARISQQRVAAATDEESLLLAGLDIDLARVRRLDLDPLVPARTSEEVALRLANLRLRLLPALDLPPEEREAAQRERVAIEASIRAELRQQELERRALLEKLRRDVPTRLEAARRDEIRRALAAVSRADAGSVARLLDEQARRIRRDFDSPSALGIVPATLTQISSNENYLRTPGGRPPSPRAIAPPRLPSLPNSNGQARLPLADVESGGASTISARGRAEQQQARWKALLARRARAWRAPAGPAPTARPR